MAIRTTHGPPEPRNGRFQGGSRNVLSSPSEFHPAPAADARFSRANRDRLGQLFSLGSIIDLPAAGDGLTESEWQLTLKVHQQLGTMAGVHGVASVDRSNLSDPSSRVYAQSDPCVYKSPPSENNGYISRREIDTEETDSEPFAASPGVYCDSIFRTSVINVARNASIVLTR